MLNLIWLFNSNFAFQSSRTPSDCNYTFLYLSILDVSRYLLIYNHLRLFKTLPHEFFTKFEQVNHLKLNYKIVGRRAGDVPSIWADTSMANKELGWKAERTLEQTLEAAWNWEKKMRNIK